MPFMMALIMSLSRCLSIGRSVIRLLGLNYLVNAKKWLTAAENKELIAEVEKEIEIEREAAVSSPMPQPESALGGVYCEDGCHTIKPKYGVPKVKGGVGRFKETEAAVHLK